MKALDGTPATTGPLQTSGHSLAPAEPLWKRAPTRDEHGGLLSDFMMLIPCLSKSSLRHQQHTLEKLQQILQDYAHVVVFADLNFKLNVLWVSVRPLPGICLELPTAINALIPEAKLVAHNPHHVSTHR